MGNVFFEAKLREVHPMSANMLLIASFIVFVLFEWMMHPNLDSVRWAGVFVLAGAIMWYAQIWLNTAMDTGLLFIAMASIHDAVVPRRLHQKINVLCAVLSSCAGLPKAR